MVYNLIKEIKTIDRDDLPVWDTRETIGQGKKFMKTENMRDIKKQMLSLVLTELLTQTGLKNKIIEVKDVHEVKARLDNNSYGDKTPGM